MENENKNLWPGRFTVTLKTDEAFGCRDVKFVLFQPEIPERESSDLLNLLGFNSNHEWYPYLVSQVEETFDLDQVTQLVEYFAGYENTSMSVLIRRAHKPDSNRIGVGAIAVGGGEDFFMFNKVEGYPLKFAIWGYYNLTDCYIIEKEKDIEDFAKMIADSEAPF